MDFHIELVHLKEDLMNEIKTLDTKFTDLYNKQSTEITKFESKKEFIDKKQKKEIEKIKEQKNNEL